MIRMETYYRVRLYCLTVNYSAMANHIIAAISKHILGCEATNTNTSFTAIIDKLFVKVTERCPNINIHIRPSKFNSPKNYAFADNDFAVVYYNDVTEVYNLGKWNNNTLVNHDHYNTTQCCGTIYRVAELLNNHIITFKTYSNENRLQESKVSSGKPVEPKGNTIEVEGSGFAVEARSLRNGKVISC